MLNNQIQLPPKEDLPPKIEDTIRNWKKLSWQEPSRSSSERVGFIPVSEANVDDDGNVKTSSVRKFLLRQDAYSDKILSSESSTAAQADSTEALSYADADFFTFGDLQADHLQPSEQIIARQLELILAMNLDPIFGKTVFNSSDNDDYFICDPISNRYSGTKYFFMLYHNCIDNLW